LNQNVEIVIGARPIEKTTHFSYIKKSYKDLAVGSSEFAAILMFQMPQAVFGHIVTMRP